MKADSSTVRVRFQRPRVVEVRTPTGRHAPLYGGPGPEYGVIDEAANGNWLAVYDVAVTDDGKTYYAIWSTSVWISAADVRDVTGQMPPGTALNYLSSGIIIVLGIMIVVAAIYLLAH